MNIYYKLIPLQLYNYIRILFTQLFHFVVNEYIIFKEELIIEAQIAST